MPFVDIEGQSIFYTHHTSQAEGPERQPPLLLVHGAGGSHLHWPAHLRRLAGRTVFALDLPGHGRSPGLARTTIDGYAAFLTAFVTALNLEQFVLAGHSMGGAIALEYALRQGERLAGLVLVGAGARLTVSQALLEALRSDFAGATETITRFAYGAQTSAAQRRQFLKRLRENDPTILRDDFLACAQFDQRNRVADLDLPTMIVVGREDQLTPVSVGERLHAQLPNSQLRVVEGAGHMVMLEKADAVIDLFQGFLTTLSIKT